MSSIRLQKILADAGVASRRTCESLILAGLVKVNGTVVRILGSKADPTIDTITVKGKPVRMKEKNVFIKLYKPRGYVSSNVSREGKSILELVKIPDRVFPVGRLDKESEGLLILTNDGDYALKATHPRFEHEKEYVVELDKPLEQRHVRQIEGGFELEGEKLLPMRVSKMPLGSLSIKLILKEGKKRQIRRVFDEMGYSVRRLIRVRIGNITLGNMQPGEWKTFILS